MNILTPKQWKQNTFMLVKRHIVHLAIFVFVLRHDYGRCQRQDIVLDVHLFWFTTDVCPYVILAFLTLHIWNVKKQTKILKKCKEFFLCFLTCLTNMFLFYFLKCEQYKRWSIFVILTAYFVCQLYFLPPNGMPKKN